MSDLTPAEELRAAAARLRCEHTHSAAPPHSIWAPSPCEKCGVSGDAPRDVPERLREPLAELLEHLADDMSDYDAEEVDYLRGDDVEVAVVVDDDERIRPDWTAALAVARALLGGAEQPGGEPAPAEQLVAASTLRPDMVVSHPTWNGGHRVRIVTAHADNGQVAIRYRDVRAHHADVQVKVPPDFQVTPGCGFVDGAR